MKVISSDKPVTANNSICYKPYVRYIVSDFEAMYLVNNTPITEWTHSSFNSYERRYGGQNLNGKKVVMYRHTAFGDQLMISAIPRYLKTLYPQATIHLYCDPGVVNMWQGNRFVGGAAIPLPMPFDLARSYDYHIFFEGMLENNGEPDQNNCYDDAFGMIGLPGVPPQFKRPYLDVLPTDYNVIKDLKLDLHGKYMVYHVAPANKNRRYNPEKGMDFMEMFLESREDWRIFLVGRTEGDKEDMSRILKHDSVINLVDKTANFRSLVPVLEKASLAVCPDSSVMHLAACFNDVPVISLWGVFDPNDRVKYYPNHFPIFKPEVCRFAACRNHEFSLPLEKCAKAEGWKDGSVHCAVLDNISPEDIMNKVEVIIG